MSSNKIVSRCLVIIDTSYQLMALSLPETDERFGAGQTADGLTLAAWPRPGAETHRPSAGVHMHAASRASLFVN